MLERPNRSPYEVVATVAIWDYFAVRIQLPKRVVLGLFLSLEPKRRAGLVEDIGNICTWPPINFFGPPCLPYVFKTLFDPCMYFCESKVANMVVSRQVMSSSLGKAFCILFCILYYSYVCYICYDIILNIIHVLNYYVHSLL